MPSDNSSVTLQVSCGKLLLFHHAVLTARLSHSLRSCFSERGQFGIRIYCQGESCFSHANARQGLVPNGHRTLIFCNSDRFV